MRRLVRVITDTDRIDFLNRCCGLLDYYCGNVMIRFAPGSQYTGSNTRDVIDKAIEVHEWLTDEPWREWKHEAK